jgi:hypothetical protein
MADPSLRLSFAGLSSLLDPSSVSLTASSSSISRLPLREYLEPSSVEMLGEARGVLLELELDASASARLFDVSVRAADLRGDSVDRK